MNAAFFQRMAPSAQRSLIVTALIGGVAVALYMFAIEPSETSVTKAREELQGLQDTQFLVDGNLRQAERIKTKLQELSVAREPYLNSMLTPLLESYAMRAKSLLDPFAAGAGLLDVDYQEVPVRALPLPKPQPKQLYARRPIKITCRGSYQEIVSFLMRVEKEMPLVSMQSISIKSQNDIEVQGAEIVFEWLVEGQKVEGAKPKK